MAQNKKYTGESVLNILKNVIDRTFLKKKDATTALDIYPIGAIYLSVNNTNPSELFGGTWEQIAGGRTLVGFNENDDNFNIIEKTGGSSSVTIDSSFLPSHRHYFSDGGHSHSMAEHSHVIDLYTNTEDNNHYHTVNSHTHAGPSHTHSFSTTTGNESSHTHTMRADMDVIYNTSGQSWSVHREGSTNNNHTSAAATSKSKNLKISSGSSHNHSVSGTTDSAGTGATGSSSPDTGTQSSTHRHHIWGSTDTSTAISTGGTYVSGYTDYAGSSSGSNSFSILQPYFTCYIWKRIN